MARHAPNAFYSGSFNTLRNSANRRQVVLDSEVTSYASIAAATLAETPIDNDDMAEAAGSVSGRRLNISQIADIDIDASGDATHVAIVDDDADTVLYVTVCTTQTLTSGGKVTIPGWGIELRAPAAP